MKKIVSLMLLCSFVYAAKAQQPVSSMPLKITDNKTTFLIFPFSILHVDRGTKEVLAQQINEAKNILLVKASVADFKNTNLTVVTEDGAVYPFEVSYAPVPASSVYCLGLQLLPVSTSNVENQKMNVRDLESLANSIVNKRKSIGGMKDYQWDMAAKVKGIYIRDGVLFFQIGLNNFSPIDYDIDFIRFYIRDQKRSKRTASQEIEVRPLYVAGKEQQVKANEEKNMVFALDKFTIPDAKILLIEIMEKNGGRHLRLKVTNNKLVKARILPEDGTNK